MTKGRPSKRRGINPQVDNIPKKRLDPASFENEFFSWRVHDAYIDYDHPQFGWDKVDILHCLRVVIQGLHSYEGLTWREVRCKNHCHPWVVNELPTEFYQRLEERQIFVDELFQISLGNKPRVLGYKHGKVFYLIWYDPKHKFWPINR